jgi:predicted Fe-Mo cluster-binding NifX family protein
MNKPSAVQAKIQFDIPRPCVCDVISMAESRELQEMEKSIYAVASNGPAQESPVSDQAARAPFYLLFDGSGNILETLENPVSPVTGRAAPQAVGFLAGRGIRALLAARFGQKMLRELDSIGVDPVEANGPVKTAISLFLESSGA